MFHFLKKRRFQNTGRTLRFSQSSKHKPSPPIYTKRFIKKKLIFLKPFISIIILFSIFFLFFISPYFQIQNIDIKRKNLSIDSSEIEIFLNKEILGKNIFTTSLSDASQLMKKKFPQWESILLTKSYPQTIEVSVANYSSFASINIEEPIIETEENTQKEKCNTEEDKPCEKLENAPKEDTTKITTYIINKLGNIAYPEIGDSPELIIIYDEVITEPINIGKNIIPYEEIQTMQAITNTLLNDYSLATKEIQYFHAGKEAHFNVYQFTLWFDLQQNTKEQFKKIDQAIANIDSNTIQYLDLRISNRIIYKEKDNK
jgi:hypothetical protein